MGEPFGLVIPNGFGIGGTAGTVTANIDGRGPGSGGGHATAGGDAGAGVTFVTGGIAYGDVVTQLTGGGGGRIAVVSNTGGQTVDGTVQAIAGASGQGVACGFVADLLFLTDPETGEAPSVAMSAPATAVILSLGAFALARRRK